MFSLRIHGKLSEIIRVPAELKPFGFLLTKIITPPAPEEIRTVGKTITVNIWSGLSVESRFNPGGIPTGVSRLLIRSERELSQLAALPANPAAAD